MISQSQFMQRTGVLYDSMCKRFRAKHWKSGKRAGSVRDPGREVPFTKEQFRSWAMQEVGYQAKPCPYCSRPIDVLNMSPDHRIPVSRGGSLALSNLDAICADCNRLKGALTGKEFGAFLDGMRTFPVDAQRDIFKRMRAGAMGLRNRFFDRKSKSPQPQLQPQQTEFF
jgi:hypothetical protein